MPEPAKNLLHTLRDRTRVETLPVVFIILAVGVFHGATIREGHNWGDDFSMYIHHARNIVEGTPYGDTGYIYNPSFMSLGPRTYPPVFPLLLSPIYFFFGLNLAAMKGLVIALFLLSLFVIFLLFRDDLPGHYVVILVAVLGFNPLFWDFKDIVISDLPFLFFIFTSLLFIRRTQRMRQPLPWQSVAQALVLGTLIYLAYGTRSVGVVLLPTFLIYEAMTLKQLTWRGLLTTCVVGMLIIFQNVFVHSDGSYLEQLATITPVGVLENLIRYPISLLFLWYTPHGQSFVKGIFRGMAVCLFLGMGSLAATECAARIRQRVTLFEIFLVAYLIPIMIWPSEESLRFLIPVIPLLVFYAFEAIRRLALARGRRWATIIMAMLVVAISISYGIGYALRDYGPIADGVGSEDATELFKYVKGNSRETDVFIFRKPRALSLLARRRASGYHEPKDPRTLWRYCEEIGATHLVVSAMDGEYLRRFVQKYQDRLQLQWSNRTFALYDIKR